MTSLLVTRPLPERVIAALDSKFAEDVRSETIPLTPEVMADALGKYDAILPTLGDPLSAAVIGQAPELKRK